MQQPSENIRSYITELSCEVIEAFPNESERERRRLLVKQFFRGLRNKQLAKLMLHQMRREDLADLDLDLAIRNM